VLGDLRDGVVAGQQDVGKGLVVAQQHVVARHEALDEIALQQQRLDLGMGFHHFHGHGLGHHALQAARQLGDLGVVGDPALQIARLADVDRVALAVQHAVDARAGREGLHRAGDDLHAARQTFAQHARIGARDIDLLPFGEVGFGRVLLQPHGRALAPGRRVLGQALGQQAVAGGLLGGLGHRFGSRRVERRIVMRAVEEAYLGALRGAGIPYLGPGPRRAKQARRKVTSSPPKLRGAVWILSTKAVDKSVVIRPPHSKALREFYIFVNLPTF
jgi:hypothetical protein